MTTKDDDVESELLKQIFEEIMKMIREKKIRIEVIVQRSVEQDIMSQDAFNRIYKILSDHGKKKQWL